METVDAYWILGLLGSVASIVSLLIAAPNTKSRILHVVYAVLLTIVVGVSMYRLAKSKKNEEALQLRLRKYNEIEKQASDLLATHTYEYTDDVGLNRGFFLAGLAFLEKNKSDFPEVYEIAKNFAVGGIRISESVDAGSPQAYDERKRMNDGAQAMKALLRGIGSHSNTR